MVDGLTDRVRRQGHEDLVVDERGKGVSMDLTDRISQPRPLYVLLPPPDTLRHLRLAVRLDRPTHPTRLHTETTDRIYGVWSVQTGLLTGIHVHGSRFSILDTTE